MLATVLTFGMLWAPVTAGGTAPLIATGLLAASGGNWTPVACYLAVTVMISLIAIACAMRINRPRLPLGETTLL